MSCAVSDAANHAWVIGRGGLLGSAIERALRRTDVSIFILEQRFSWTVPAVLQRELEVACEHFAASLGPRDRWTLHWAAGVGSMGSTAQDLVTETAALEGLLGVVERSGLCAEHGRVALASSAGAIYAGATDAVIDERTVEGPTTAYAHAKLAQERCVLDHAARFGTGALIARISTLYGAGQASGKRQGLLTHISRCLIRNTPVQIFVPLDTIRDYLAADDAAAIMLDALDGVGPRRTAMKIVASERPVTISEILSIFKRLARRPPRIVTSGSASSSLYTRRMQFRSRVPPSRSRPPLDLLIGISRLLAAERLRYVAAGHRPPLS